VPLLLVFALHNLAEFSAYVFFLSESITIQIFKTYYSVTFVMVTFIAIYSIKVSNARNANLLVNLFYLLGIVLSVTVYFSDYIVSGAKDIGYSLTAVKGQYYVASQVLVVLTLFYSLAILYRGYNKSKDANFQTNCLISIIALSPIILSLVLIIGLMAAGVKINAAGVLPIGTSLFLYILIKYEPNHRMVDIRRWVPNSPEKKLTDELMKLSSLYSMDRIAYKDMLREFERISIKYKYAESDRNISETARRMKLKRSTLYSMIDRTDIKEILDK